MDRESESVAREVIERLCVTPEARNAWIDLAVDSIHAASSISSEAWEVTLFSNLVRLNVGQISVLELFGDCVGIYTEGELALPRRRGIRRAPRHNYSAVPVPSQRWLVTHDVLVDLPHALRKAHHRLVKTAAMAKARSPFRKAHSPGVVAYLNFTHRPGRRIHTEAPLYPVHDEDATPFGDPESNVLVEAQAVAIASEHYKAHGWRVESVEREKIGYDLRCVRRREELHVEVKGASNPCNKFIITANEARRAITDNSFVLLLVDSIRSGHPRLRSWVAAEFRTAIILEPSQYWAILKTAG